MKILIFTKYTEKGASSRMRSYQYISYLQENGIDVTVSPLFPDEYLDQLYNVGKVSRKLIARSYIRRLIQLFSVSRYDKIIIEKELFPYLPAWAEILLGKLGIRYMVDYDDAIFHNYDLHPKGVIRFF
ncbi:MAG: hypothetical protein LUG51_13965 [Tannerellaceae bacterium]|nr:hypothetical protein [Tannerellaceae bacterium]